MTNDKYHFHTKLGGPDCKVCSQNLSTDFEKYLDAIIENRKQELEKRLEERSIRVNSIHRGTKE
jgi:hypothetical protein